MPSRIVQNAVGSILCPSAGCLPTQYANFYSSSKTFLEVRMMVTFVEDPCAPWWQADIRWLAVLGEQTGGIGPLGVVESMRRRGIGLALAARVTEVLRERGLEKSYIGWTWLVDWYGRLGYQIWQEYIMSWRQL
jgi:GNAT superfamily N-acetyltransferase